MYRLHDFLRGHLGFEPEQIVSDEIFCIHCDAELTFRTNHLQESIRCYTFTLVTRGWMTGISNGRKMTLQAGDLYTYAPGFTITVLQASEDYHSICLMADEQLTFDISVVRNVIRAAYFPVVQLSEPKLHLSADAARQLQSRMNLICDYLQSDHLFLRESLRTLYTLFLLDLMNFMERTLKHDRISERTENIFINFTLLLPEHFAAHHDVAFYADRLHITTTHLSRIVRKVTGRTVVDYINQMLLMEASWLLQTTDLQLTAIAERLHFSDQSSFGRFFTRMKGISPKAYRMGR